MCMYIYSCGVISVGTHQAGPGRGAGAARRAAEGATAAPSPAGVSRANTSVIAYDDGFHLTPLFNFFPLISTAVLNRCLVITKREF